MIDDCTLLKHWKSHHAQHLVVNYHLLWLTIKYSFSTFLAQKPSFLIRIDAATFQTTTYYTSEKLIMK